jgi:hypothetical protein
VTENGGQKRTLSETVRIGASGCYLREPVTAPLEDREVDCIPEHRTNALRNAVVPGMGLRPPGGGAGDAPPLSAHDARVDETMGRWKDVEAGRPWSET